MTGRVCHVHGEYSDTGICRWCEEGVRPARPGVRFVMDLPAQPDGPVRLPGLKGLWARPERVSVNEAGVPEYTWTIGPEVDSFEKLARVANVDEAPPLTGKIILDTMLKWEARLAASRFRYDVLMLKHWHSEMAAAEESRLLAQHAALRWERVARRWNYKHHGGGGTEEGRAYVWRWWLEQMDRQSAGLPLVGPFPRGFYAW